ncbi:hypothetical protein BCR35DRAFT_353911 [Leucosporidium creatinivorum]|uniref:SH3 domain-containing protein n=1 Tax=Leucosporidium creatinivorum TaxID=106004 RepID=A0A1Y2ESQ3_9BASI|nr:hypothetical protein BCR35DRAFT_353911 [Leucosporidium creatinivorum]
MAQYGQDQYDYDQRQGGGRGPSLTIDVSASNRARGQQRGIDPRDRQAQQQHDYELAQQEAHMIMEGNESPDSGDEVAEALRIRNGEEDLMMDDEEGQLHSQQYHQHHHDDGMEHDEHDDIDDSGSFSDSLSSSPSIPDEDIDFTLVYALHTFLATVDGQASVVKGDKLLLLDDSNSYWWLVRVLKTQAVGYIPAENIETPWERLARLNKHRNVDLTTATQQDVITGPLSTVAQTRFETRIPPSRQPHPHQSQHPSAKGTIASPSHKDHPRNISPDPERPERSGSSKAKTVIFTAPTYYEHSANGEETDEDEYDDEMEGEEGEMQGHQDFDDDGEESEFSDDNLTEDADGTEVVGGRQIHQTNLHEEIQGQVGMVQDEGADGGDEDDSRDVSWEQEQAMRQQQEQQAAAEARWQQEQQQAALAPQSQDVRSTSPQQLEHRALSPQQQESLYQQQQQERYEQQQAQLAAQQRPAGPGQHLAPPAGAGASVARRPSDGSIKGREINENDFQPDAPTKKLTATPPIVRDPTFDINDPFGEKAAGRASSPQRVRGVEVVDPTDPRYTRLVAGGKRPLEEAQTNVEHQRPSSEYDRQADTSLNSMETASSYISGQSTISGGAPSSDDGHRTSTPGSVAAAGGKKLRKTGRESIDGEGEKKRKSGGILGLFRKKDKKKKEGEAEARSSEESGRVGSPTGRRSGGDSASEMSEPRTSGEMRQPDRRRESQTAESMFSTDAALRQQQVEAKQALYHQYGVQRAPGDVSNTMTPRGDTRQQNLSPATGGLPSPSLQAPQRMRPGSLIGSPSIPGLDVPLLSVLRVFAGDHVEAEATFKTVLLNRSTTASDLVKQSMQRFRLAGHEDRDEYYLTIKELGGEERALDNDQKPLEIFESLVEQAESGFNIPSVKRSSVGSINSIASNLSLNPAITRLGMNDWSDDSAVKFYLNRRPADLDASRAGSDIESISTATGVAPAPVLGASDPSAATTNATAPAYRFAVRILIHPSDLPENVVFDPQSNAIIPKAVLVERQQRHALPEDTDPISPHARDKIIFFPRNVNVSEVIEAGLDRFGIVDGVVDGGDEVEDRVSRRRSVSRVKYGLAVERDGHETLLHAAGKLLDSYSAPPIFKPYDRTSKEFRRRSVDATLILGAPQDIQPSDPVFIIRRAAYRGPATRAAGPIPTTIDELEERQQSEGAQTEPVENKRASQTSTYGASAEDLEILARATSPQATRQEIIAAQRAVSRANQRALLSAQKNQEQGVDISIPDRGVIRSTRDAGDDKVRYSFINQEGEEVDISKIVENEWSTETLAEPASSTTPRSVSQASRYTSTTTDADSFRTARENNSADEAGNTSQGLESDEEEERLAVAALRETNVDIDSSKSTSGPSSTALKKTASSEGEDVLQDALGPRMVSSPLFNESLQDRLDRVLAKVKEDKALGRRPGSRPRSFQLREFGVAGTSSSGRLSPASLGRRSPDGGRDSPSIDQLIGGRSQPGGSPLSASAASRQGHGKKASLASMTSTRSSNTDQPSTPITAGSNANSTFTPISSTESRMSNHPPPPPTIAYRDDFGLETLVTIVDAESNPRRRPAVERDAGMEALFGRSLRDLDVHPDVKEWYAAPSKTLDDLDTRLDRLLAQFSSSAGVVH